MLSKKIKVLFFVLIAALFSFTTFAEEEDSDWFWEKEISQITFEGLKSIKKSELSGVTSSYIGKTFNDTTYNELLDRLYNLAYFEEIEPYAKHDSKNPDKILLVFNVKEHPCVSSVEFKGNKKIRNNELKETVSIKNGDVYIEQTVLMDERALRDLYVKKGYSSARISHTIKEEKDGIKVIFNVQEGEGTVITKIRFSGNTVFSERSLKSKLSLKEEGFLKDGAFQKSSLEADKQAVVNYYMNRGYVDAHVLDVIQESVRNDEKDREELTLTFVVQEGAQYTFSGLTLSGNEIFSTEKLMSYIKLKEGDIYNQAQFQEGLS